MKTHARSLVGLLRSHFGDVQQIRFVEVGVWRGELSEVLLRNVPKLTLWMVDPWERVHTPTMPRSTEEIIAARREAEDRTIGLNRVIMKNTSERAAKKYAKSPEWFHGVFVDACHLYESVQQDCRLWWPLIKLGGILSGHDYGGQGDRRKGWGVKKAVDEFAAKKGVKVNVLPGLVWWIQKTR